MAGQSSAGFASRIGAYLVDALALSVIDSMILGFAMGLFGPGAKVTGALMMLAATLAYFAVFEGSSWHATPGKRLAGLHVTNLDGTPVGFGRAALRAVAKVGTAVVTLGVGFVVALFTERKQALHDLLAGTLVLVRERVPAPVAVPSTSSTASPRVTVPEAAPARTISVAPERIRAIIGAFVDLPIEASQASSHTWDLVEKWNPRLAAWMTQKKPDVMIGGIVNVASISSAVARFKEQLDTTYQGCNLTVQHSGMVVKIRSGQVFDGTVLLATFVTSDGREDVIVSDRRELTIVPGAMPTSAASAPTACAACGTELNLQRKIGAGVMMGDALGEMLIRTPYRCRQCRTVLCMACAQSKLCPTCGGRVFDAATELLH